MNKDNLRSDYIEEEFVHIHTDFLEMMTELYYLQEKYYKSVVVRFFRKKTKCLYKDAGMECCWYNQEVIDDFFEKTKSLCNINLGTWPSRKQIEQWNNSEN